MPLSEVMGIDEARIQGVIEETIQRGSLRIKSISGEAQREIWWTSFAVNDENHALTCIAVVLRTNLSEGESNAPLKEDQRNLVEYYLTKTGTQQIDENQVIKTYFLEQMKLLYSLALQFNGEKVADQLFNHMQQAAQQNHWNLIYNERAITIPEEFEGQMLANLLSAALGEARNFTANQINLKLVEQEMKNLDKSLGAETLSYVDKYNLRGLPQMDKIVG